MAEKISIRFFDDNEVRAVWDDENAKWWFSVLDIVGVLRDEKDYIKNRNYWKYLKAKLKKENPHLVSRTTQVKLIAADGKKDYLTAMEKSTINSVKIKTLLQNALTEKIYDRAMFMKGIDYSYYYEQDDDFIEYGKS